MKCCSSSFDMIDNVTKTPDAHVSLSQVDNSIYHSIIIQIKVSVIAFVSTCGIYISGLVK